jgi:tRNA(Ile)-lysidine synthase
MSDKSIKTLQPGSPFRGAGGNLYLSFINFIKTENLFHAKDRLLLAVSGGVDSVVLCELCKHAGYDFAIAHCNFQLRGAESNSDEVFVTELAKKYNVEIFVKKFATEKYADENKLSIQVAARELRYSWFAELLGKVNDDSKREETTAPFRRFGGFLLTAHHADDNIETILMNFFKGSGINGLKGMLPKQDKIMRPLLFATKEQILDFAQDQVLSWREDSSNSSDKYTRNYFRNQLIPGLQKVFPQVEENLLHNADRFREINTIYQNAVQQIKKKLVTIKGTEVHLPVLKLVKTAALHTILYEVIKEFGFTAHQVTEVQKLLHSDSGKYVQSATHRVLRNREWLIISALDDLSASAFLIEEDDAQVIFPGGKLLILKKDDADAIDPDPFTVQLDARGIKFPLLLRKWKRGDYFYPLGMPKKKKLSRFFIDQKMSLNQKENTWVIEADKKICWIIGRRIDDRFKIIPATTSVLKFTLRPAEQAGLL